MTIVNLTNGDSQHGQSPPAISTDILIIGTGPAGASLACFLALHGQYSFIHCILLKHMDTYEDNHGLGIHGIMVSSAPGSADTPRAHLTNMAAMG